MSILAIFITMVSYIMMMQEIEIQQQQAVEKQHEWEDFKASNSGEMIGDSYVIHGTEKEIVYAIEEEKDISDYYVIWMKNEDNSITTYKINKKHAYLYLSNSDNTYICKGTAYHTSENIGIIDYDIYDLYLSEYDLKKLSGQLNEDELVQY